MLVRTTMTRFHSLSLLNSTRRSLLGSYPSRVHKPFSLIPRLIKPFPFHNPSALVHNHGFTSFSGLFTFLSLSSSNLRFFNTYGSSQDTGEDKYETDDNFVIEEWDEEDDTEPEIGDGGAGGGIVLQNIPWGEQALSLAREVLLQFGDDVKLYSFKTTPRGYIYVRLDKLSNEYGCPSMEEIESYSQQYKKRLDEEGSIGKMPDDLALEVSSPGAERLIRVPDDLHRFRDFPMVVAYVERETGAKSQEKSGVFFLDSIEMESEHCLWKLADVKENRDPASKGRPLSRKQKDWRLKLPFSMLKRVTLYLDC